jgi:hypothetical protein
MLRWRIPLAENHQCSRCGKNTNNSGAFCGRCGLPVNCLSVGRSAFTASVEGSSFARNNSSQDPAARTPRATWYQIRPLQPRDSVYACFLLIALGVLNTWMLNPDPPIPTSAVGIGATIGWTLGTIGLCAASGWLLSITLGTRFRGSGHASTACFAIGAIGILAVSAMGSRGTDPPPETPAKTSGTTTAAPIVPQLSDRGAALSLQKAKIAQVGVLASDAEPMLMGRRRLALATDVSLPSAQVAELKCSGRIVSHGKFSDLIGELDDPAAWRLSSIALRFVISDANGSTSAVQELKSNLYWPGSDQDGKSRFSLPLYSLKAGQTLAWSIVGAKGSETSR